MICFIFPKTQTALRKKRKGLAWWCCASVWEYRHPKSESRFKSQFFNFQSCGHVPRKATALAPSIWVPDTHMREIYVELQNPAFAWFCPSYSEHLENDAADGWETSSSLSFPPLFLTPLPSHLLLFLTLFHSAFHNKKQMFFKKQLSGISFGDWFFSICQ